MAEIAPFRALSYDAGKIGSLDRVVSPPYDVISPEEQESLYSANPYNYVRVILNRGPNDPYQLAAAMLSEWLDSGVLAEDNSPALYLYRQEFTSPGDGRRYSRTGFCCALKLEPYSAGVVLAHPGKRA